MSVSQHLQSCGGAKDPNRQRVTQQNVNNGYTCNKGLMSEECGHAVSNHEDVNAKDGMIHTHRTKMNPSQTSSKQMKRERHAGTIICDELLKLVP